MGSSYDNAAAEALGKSYKRELVWRDGPWKDRDDLETATAQWVNWYNRTRPHRANPDDLSPAAAEHRYHRNHTTTAAAPATASPTLHKTQDDPGVLANSTDCCGHRETCR